jgi:hypothetical protein
MAALKKSLFSFAGDKNAYQLFFLARADLVAYAVSFNYEGKHSGNLHVPTLAAGYEWRDIIKNKELLSEANLQYLKLDAYAPICHPETYLAARVRQMGMWLCDEDMKAFDDTIYAFMSASLDPRRIKDGVLGAKFTLSSANECFLFRDRYKRWEDFVDKGDEAIAFELERLKEELLVPYLQAKQKKEEARLAREKKKEETRLAEEARNARAERLIEEHSLRAAREKKEAEAMANIAARKEREKEAREKKKEEERAAREKKEEEERAAREKKREEERATRDNLKEEKELIERYDANKQREQEAREKTRRKEERNEYAKQLKQLKTPALEEQLREAGLKHKIPKEALGTSRDRVR